MERNPKTPTNTSRRRHRATWTRDQIKNVGIPAETHYQIRAWLLDHPGTMIGFMDEAIQRHFKYLQSTTHGQAA